MEKNAELEQPSSKLPLHVSFHLCQFVICAGIVLKLHEEAHGVISSFRQCFGVALYTGSTVRIVQSAPSLRD